MDHDKILLSGGLWKEYCQGESFEKVFQQYVKSVTWEEDLEFYKSFMDLEVLRVMYNQGITTKECSIGRYVDGYLCWMKLTLHIFQERYTGNMYALLYLKNIDEEQRKNERTF